MGFHIWLRNKRMEKGLSTRELSRRIKKSSNYISSIELGRTKKPSKDVAVRILKELEVNNAEEILKNYEIASEIDVKMAQDSFDDYELLAKTVQERIEHLEPSKLRAISLFFEHQHLFSDIAKVIELQKEKGTNIPLKVLEKNTKFLISELEEKR